MPGALAAFVCIFCIHIMNCKACVHVEAQTQHSAQHSHHRLLNIAALEMLMYQQYVNLIFLICIERENLNVYDVCGQVYNRPVCKLQPIFTLFNYYVYSNSISDKHNKEQ